MFLGKTGQLWISNTQNVQHNTLNQQNVQQNLIDRAQLEQLVENTVQQRVDATISQMQMRVREAVNKMEGQHNERLAQLQEEKNAQTQKVQAETALMIERGRQNVETERQMPRQEAEGHVVSIQRQAEGPLAHTPLLRQKVRSACWLERINNLPRIETDFHMLHMLLRKKFSVFEGKLRCCGVGLFHKVM